MRRFLAGAVALTAAAAWALRDVPAALGARPSGSRAERVRRSPQYRDGAFYNPMATVDVPAGPTPKIMREFLLGKQKRKPSAPIPLATPSATRSDLDVIWYGHASALVDIEGTTILFDPVWADRCSPSSKVGPRRLHKPPVPLSELPRL